MSTLTQSRDATSERREDLSLPALLRRDPEAPGSRIPTGDGSEDQRSPSRPHVGLLITFPLVVAAGICCASLATGNGVLPPLPFGAPAEAKTVVMAVGDPPGVGRERLDARQLRSLARSAPAAVAAASKAAPAEESRRYERSKKETQPQGSEQQPPEGGGGSDGGGSDEGDPGLTLPVLGETPLPDPGVEAPELPVDPEDTLPATGDLLPDTDVIDTDVTLP